MVAACARVGQTAKAVELSKCGRSTTLLDALERDCSRVPTCRIWNDQSRHRLTARGAGLGQIRYQKFRLNLYQNINPSRGRISGTGKGESE